MATIPDSVKATLDAQWTGAGGVEPTYYVGEDYTYTSQPPVGQNYIWVMSKDLDTDMKPVNESFSTVTHTLPIIVNTPTSGDRLMEIADEVERILSSVAITGANYQYVSRRSLSPPENLKVHRELIILTIMTFLVDSGTAYGPYTTTTFITDVLTVNTSFTLGRAVTAILDEDNMASDLDTALATQQSIKAYADAVATAAAADVDADIVTHAAIAAAHHAKYTDAEAVTAMGVKGDGNPLHHDIYEDSDVEAVITAELVNGQSIDNAIDALITTHDAIVDAHHAKYTDAEADARIAIHDAIADAHHAKYTDAEVEAIITAEIVGGQSIDNAIDSLITTHTADDNAHHEVVEAHADLSDSTLTGAYLEDLLMFGSANAAWVPVIPVANSTAGQWFDQSADTLFFQSTGTHYLVCWLPLPTAKGGLKLYVNGSYVGLNDADAGDKCISRVIYGMNAAGRTSLDSNAVALTTADDHTDTTMDVDCSPYYVVNFAVAFTIATVSDLEITGLALRCYYAA